MDIKFPDGLVVPGDDPILIIGPNGVGKTRLGVNIARTNNGERVAALRNVEIPEIPMQRFSQASQYVKNALNDVLNEHWRQSFELQNLLSEILAEDREKAVSYREASISTSGAPLDKSFTDTRLRKIVTIWNRHFLGRTIKIDYEPKVERKIDGKPVEYAIKQMSEGERTALYLAARVVSCTSKIIVVDEPETFFHPILARGFWDDLEDLSPELRFVYITHDIPFALSRRKAQFAIARSEIKAELLPNASTLPPDLIAEIFGAASFSVTASRLIFCEGKLGSHDVDILSAWHDCRKTAVVAVGSCVAVRECVSVFRAGKVTSGFEAFGYVDRDGLPDSTLNSDANIKAHPVYEIEGFLCIDTIFKGLAEYNGIPKDDAEKRYQDFLVAAKAVFKDVLLNKEILNRAKKRAEIELLALMNPIKPDPDLSKVRTNFVSAEPKDGWQKYFVNVFEQEEQRLTASFTSAPPIFLRDFPSKSYYFMAAAKLDMTSELLVRTICSALKLTEREAKENKKLASLRDILVSSMTPFMWPRQI